MAKEGRIDEQKTAGASYIINFYNQIQQLNSLYAQYNNVLFEIESKYGQTEEQLGGVTDEERNVIINIAQQTRYMVHLTYISYISISAGTGDKIDKEIENIYNNIASIQKVEDKSLQKKIAPIIISKLDLRKYTTQLNAFLVKDIIKKLLETSQELAKDIYPE